MNVKTLLTAIVLTAMSVHVATAQRTGESAPRSVYVEVLGASNLVGLNYDARLKPLSPWGYRIGLAYTYSRNYNMFSGSNSLRGPAIPLELNCLLGRRHSRFEMGFGLNLGYYTEKYDTWNWKQTGEVDGIPYYTSEYAGEARHSLWGYYFFGNIGYRYQSARGFQFRAGFNPSFNLGGSHAVTKGIFPYVSFGCAL